MSQENQDDHGPESIIIVQELRKNYYSEGRKIEAVRSVSFDVKEGEIFGLLGPNGAGKTTTIGMLTTRVDPTDGHAFIDRQEVRQKIEVKRKIAVVPQTLTLDRSLTARENLVFHAKYFGVPAEERERKADELLDWLDLTARQHHYVRTFSGGMAQRLMIARALMHRPKVLFLDEATTGLDPQSRRLLWEKIIELNKEGQTIVLTTHYMDEADTLCDRVAILDHGQILAIGEPSQLKNMIKSSYVVEAEVSEVLPGFLDDIAGLSGKELKVEGNHVFIYCEGGRSLVHQVVDIASKHDVEVCSVQLHTPTLEDVFISLTGRGLRD